MKKIITLCTVLFFSAAVSSALYAVHVDGQSVPPQIQSNFQEKFPRAANVKWDYRKTENTYRADFFDGQIKVEVIYTGLKWIETVYEMLPRESLPQKAHAYIQLRYRGFVITEIDKLERADAIVFTVKMDKGIGELEADFDAAGKFLRERN